VLFGSVVSQCVLLTYQGEDMLIFAFTVGDGITFSSKPSVDQVKLLGSLRQKRGSMEVHVPSF
jgi:hypothetical protein